MSFGDFIRNNNTTTFQALSELDVVDVSTEIIALRNDISTTNGQLTQLSQIVYNNGSDIGLLRVDIGDLTTQVNLLITDTAAISNSVQLINAELDALDVIVDSQGDSISSLETAVQNININIISLTTRANVSENNINDIHVQLTQIDTRFTGVNNLLTAMQSQIDSNIARIVALETNLSRDIIQSNGQYTVWNTAPTNLWVRTLKVNNLSYRISLGRVFSGNLGGTNYSDMYFVDTDEVVGRLTTSQANSVPMGKLHLYYGNSATSHTRAIVFVSNDK